MTIELSEGIAKLVFDDMVEVKCVSEEPEIQNTLLDFQANGA